MVEGVIFVSYDENPELKSIVCDVEFSNGHAKDHAANAISENMLTIVKSKGF